jgi:uncharacterized membrane protein
MTNTARVMVVLLGIAVIATLAVILSGWLEGWVIVPLILLAGAVLGYLIAPSRSS